MKCPTCMRDGYVAPPSNLTIGQRVLYYSQGDRTYTGQCAVIEGFTQKGYARIHVRWLDNDYRTVVKTSSLDPDNPYPAVEGDF